MSTFIFTGEVDLSFDIKIIYWTINSFPAEKVLKIAILETAVIPIWKHRFHSWACLQGGRVTLVLWSGSQG